jgi:hypothetical protein
VTFGRIELRDVQDRYRMMRRCGAAGPSTYPAVSALTWLLRMNRASLPSAAAKAGRVLVEAGTSGALVSPSPQAHNALAALSRSRRAARLTVPSRTIYREVA